MNIQVTEIDHSEQRYPTVGDWRFRPDLLLVNVSKTGDWRMNACIALHEAIEALLCYARNISEEEVTKFDLWFEAAKLPGEPGDHPDSPYQQEHFFATSVERLLATELGVDWNDYERAIEKLFNYQPVRKDKTRHEHETTVGRSKQALGTKSGHRTKRSSRGRGKSKHPSNGHNKKGRRAGKARTQYRDWT